MIKTSKEAIVKNISAFLQIERKHGYGLSQPYISAETGITTSQLSNYEAGKTIPSLLAAIAIADMFDISLDYLVGRCQNSKAHKTMKITKYKDDEKGE